MRGLQRAISWIYPAQCLVCTGLVEEHGGLCADCWRQTPFLSGLVCDSCGCALPGDSDQKELCDVCLAVPRPWEAGRAAIAYRDLGRRLVLSLKHGDRTDLAAPAAEWMWRAGRPILPDDVLFVPVPIHWSRLLMRRFNQSAELARALANLTGFEAGPDALTRTRRTPVQDGMSIEERYQNMDGAIQTNPQRRSLLRGRDVCIIDDVMTSGATMTACTEALHAAGAKRVFVLVLARVEKST